MSITPSTPSIVAVEEAYALQEVAVEVAYMLIQPTVMLDVAVFDVVTFIAFTPPSKTVSPVNVAVVPRTSPATGEVVSADIPLGNLVPDAPTRSSPKVKIAFVMLFMLAAISETDETREKALTAIITIAIRIPTNVMTLFMLIAI